MRRTFVLSAILMLGAMGAWMHGDEQSAAPSSAAPTSAAPAFNPANFTGTVTPRDTKDIRMNRYHFDPGARTKWHSHEAGQVLYVEEGRLRVQERGKPAQELAQGSTLHVSAGIPHWHGAVPGAAGITQISLSFGTTTWLEPVNEQDYKR
jgi:quercetin dioxygenase-like cupin family protein